MLDGLEIPQKIMGKWEKVISEKARIDLLRLKNIIESHTPTQFDVLLQIIERKAASPILLPELPNLETPKSSEETSSTTNQDQPIRTSGENIV
jgi:hypothetical protein